MFTYLTTSETTTTGVLPVLANTSVTGRDVATVLAGLGEAGRHVDVVVWPKVSLVVLGGSRRVAVEFS